MTSIADNVARLRAQIPAHVTIVGVTKKQSLTAVQAAFHAGITHLGVNYAQEGEGLHAALPEATWHFIGAIQSRKIKYLPAYAVVHSLDRLSTAEDLHARLQAAGKRLDVLVQINIGDEASKSGISPAELKTFVAKLDALPSLRCRGLMILPPPLEPVELRRPFFKQARELFDLYDAAGWDSLSMGTSEDFSIAVEEGATIVRLGTVLFGPRA